MRYRSPSQTAEDFHLFLDRLQLTLDYINDIKPYSIVLTGDFNCRSSHWWTEDTELPEGTALEELTESHLPVPTFKTAFRNEIS